MKVRISMLQQPEGVDPKDLLPRYSSAGAAGMDLRSSIQVSIHPGETVKVPCGFRMELPPGFEAQVRSRSGLALHGIVVANSPGTIDEDYRGEIAVLLHNQNTPGSAGKTILIGDRIAQMVIAPVVRAEIEVVDQLSSTGRGEGGFGSTGVK